MGNVQKAYSSFQRYVDVLSDSGFKAVFGDESNRDIIIGFLNAVLPEGRRVRSLSFTRTEVSGFTAANKAVRLDLRCESESGRHFIVEMQSSWQRNLFLRCVQYASKVYDSNSLSGDRNYDLPAVYLTGILSMDFGFERNGPEWDDSFISEYTFRERRTQNVIDESITIIFVELYRFSKPLSGCRSLAEQWCYALKHMKEFDSVPPELAREPFVSLFRACEIAGFDKEKRLKYERDMISERDYLNIMDSAEERGRVEGRAEGLSRGVAQVASEMKKLGISEDIIAKASGLSFGEIRAL